MDSREPVKATKYMCLKWHCNLYSDLFIKIYFHTIYF